MDHLQLRSSAFNDHDLMPERLSRLGGNTSPPLTWSEPPTGTEELVLLVEDPDTSDPPFLHWLVTGINPQVTEVFEGQVPAGGRECVNDFGEIGYGGPHPPKGDSPHRYFIRLYALNQPLHLPERPNSAQVHRAVAERELASGTLVGTFAR